jgi:hypothetical protein
VTVDVAGSKPLAVAVICVVWGPSTMPSITPRTANVAEAWPAGMTIWFVSESSVASPFCSATVKGWDRSPLRVTLTRAGSAASSRIANAPGWSESTAGMVVGVAATPRLLDSFCSKMSLRLSATTTSQR